MDEFIIFCVSYVQLLQIAAPGMVYQLLFAGQTQQTREICSQLIKIKIWPGLIPDP
jgi:hypothetical protein